MSPFSLYHKGKERLETPFSNLQLFPYLSTKARDLVVAASMLMHRSRKSSWNYFHAHGQKSDPIPTRVEMDEHCRSSSRVKKSPGLGTWTQNKNPVTPRISGFQALGSFFVYLKSLPRNFTVTLLWAIALILNQLTKRSHWASWYLCHRAPEHEDIYDIFMFDLDPVKSVLKQSGMLSELSS